MTRAQIDAFVAGKSAEVIAASALVVAGQSDGAKVELDFGAVNLPPVQELFRIGISAKVTTGATAPGSAKTFTVNLYWSDEKVATLTNVPAYLANRKTACAATAIPAGANGGPVYHELQASMVPKARFLYLTVDNTALDASGVATVSIRVNRLAA